MIELRPRFRNATAAICAVSAFACHSTKSVSLVENPDASSRPSRIEVTTKTGAKFFVYDPVVRADSLRGFTDEDRTSPTTIAGQEIQSARTRQFSGGRTAALVVGVVAAIIGTLFVLAAITFSEAAY